MAKTLTNKPLYASLHPSISEIESSEWDACAGDTNPFISHAFLKLLEDSKSLGPGTGWIPQHLSMAAQDEPIAATIPMYVKLHSWGEYVFDQAWAEALENAGDVYYPKLQICSPFSPVPGSRLLKRNSDIPAEMIGKTLIEISQRLKMSSAHITFCRKEEWEELAHSGWLPRLGIQFHWQNKGYVSFDDFLKDLTSNHRKSIKRERRQVADAGLKLITLCGQDIKEAHWNAFYQFYLATIERKWGSAYLTREFFSLLSERLGPKVILMMAEYNGTLVAGALNLRGADTLYGRNWGQIGDWPFLHFELCYYQAIEFAIQNGLRCVEAGAQGAHKIQRGYLPQLTYSLHWISHKGLSNAVSKFLIQERHEIEANFDLLTSRSPFRNTEHDI